MNRIEQIQIEKTELLAQVDILKKEHLKNYPICDCSLPFRLGEKDSKQRINNLFSKINSLVIEKNKLKKQCRLNTDL